MPRKRKEPVFDDDNPEWTKEDFARATTFPPGTTLVEAAAHLERMRGRAKSEGPKKTISIRVDADVLDAYRKLGAGWQSRMNEDLRKASRRLKGPRSTR